MTQEKTNAYLCIGGPYDGRRYGTDGRLSFRVPRTVHQAAISVHSPGITGATVEMITYVADRIFCGSPEKEVWFWRPADQTTEATMLLLLERYEQANNILWSASPFLR
jgi:hypothetical protein